MRKGNVNRKIIHGKPYYYFQYRENGKAITKSISPELACAYAYEIYTGKEYADLKKHKFRAKVVYGEALLKDASAYSSFKKRYCYSQLNDYLYGNSPGRVFALYGLRRTGKTTLMMQSILDMRMQEFSKAAFLTVTPKMEFADLIADLDMLEELGFTYFFIDEITLLEDFILMSAILADHYGAGGRVVLSGTDSLGFLIASKQQLFDRAFFLHTTYISYKEWSEVLGKEGIDEYIQYGGMMAYEGSLYPNGIPEGKAKEYVDSSIAHNVTHSLRCYNDGDHFSALRELYEKGELVNVINTLVEDTNHIFAVSTIERTFKSRDYGSLKHLIQLPRNKEALGHSLDQIDEEALTKALMDSLALLNKDRQTVSVSNEALIEIEEYFKLLDVMTEIKETNVISFKTTMKKVFVQPGIRFAQAKALIDSLAQQAPFLALPKEIQVALAQKLYEDVKGRMQEEIVLAASSLAKKDVFKALFPIGEYDMVLEEDGKSVIYEIKHSTLSEAGQARFLKDEDMASSFQKHFYPISERVVLYRGENKKVGDVTYLNVEDYLKSL